MDSLGEAMKSSFDLIFKDDKLELFLLYNFRVDLENKINEMSILEDNHLLNKEVINFKNKDVVNPNLLNRFHDTKKNLEMVKESAPSEQEIDASNLKIKKYIKDNKIEFYGEKQPTFKSIRKIDLLMCIYVLFEIKADPLQKEGTTSVSQPQLAFNLLSKQSQEMAQLLNLQH